MPGPCLVEAQLAEGCGEARGRDESVEAQLGVLVLREFEGQESSRRVEREDAEGLVVEVHAAKDQTL